MRVRRLGEWLRAWTRTALEGYGLLEVRPAPVPSRDDYGRMIARPGYVG